ncbi:MarR family winged helix-turn-helix transcriptional regulator [Ktedonobacter robiniae]|uniref:MarR family transcriptional regulator n=1 Tax=Ktedonobacter robiniae TaxID=2778365 RepID=A0ABQ3V1D6_9CHLR|nr:MarR family transcriptional regulator [Ktedonobacter robiniae]GHO58710.1 MarR family transcriptional regulator [Ktedonobacter robiniae]
MSSQHLSSHSNRERLIEAVINASRESSTAAVFFHTMIAEQVDLGATEEKTLFLLSRLGPLTAGEIAHHTGLTTPSVTSLIDRLERKGFVQRIRDTRDRRRVIIERNEERLAELNRVFSSLQENFIDFLERYSNDQLATITDFLTRSTQRSQEFLAAQQWQEGGRKGVKADREDTQ